MRRLILVSMSVGMLFMVGCKKNYTAGPEATAQQAAQAIEAGDQAKFNSLLFENAKARLGTTSEFSKLQRSFEDKNSVEIKQATVINRKALPENVMTLTINGMDSVEHIQNTLVTYAVTVQSDRAGATLIIKCNEAKRLGQTTRTSEVMNRGSFPTEGSDARMAKDGLPQTRYSCGIVDVK